jgi:hypothetical protein
MLEDRTVPSVVDRPIDEVGNNNVGNPLDGTAGIDLLRNSPARYKDGISAPGMGGGAPTFVAGSRLVSNDIAYQGSSPFSNDDVNTVNQTGLSDFGYTFGQFMDHDMDLTPDTPVNDFPIPKDPTHPTDPLAVDAADSLRMGRSVFDPATGSSTSNPRQQTNVNTAYLDLSQVYGSTTDIALSLRTGVGGKLKSSPGADGIIGTADDLLPFNNTDYFTTDQLSALGMANDSHILDSTQLFAAGDKRANETTELTSLHTLFMRNHNRLADILGAAHPDWTDDQIYQEARAINIAQYQEIVYTGYLPALLGPNALPAYSGFTGVDASIATEFSTVGYRFGHSLLNNTVPRDANDGSSVGDLSLLESFFNPSFLTPGQPGYTDVGAVLKGDADNNAQAMDSMAVSSVRNLLFGNDGTGEDLISRDMWRAHDDGIGTYNDLRAAYGLPAITDTGGGLFADYVQGQPFHGFEQISSDPAVVARFVTAYTGPTRDTFLQNSKNAGDIDPFLAGAAEDHVPGSNLGPLFQAILVDQFSRLRDGDRFFYQNQDFNAEELSLLGSGNTLAKVIKLNTNITSLQDDVFRFLVQENGTGKGFYTNRNGQTELTGVQGGTTISAPIYNALVAALTNPSDSSKLVLVDGSGNYLSASSLQSYASLKSYIQSYSGGNVALKMSIQLLTTELNVILGKVDPNSSVYVPAVLEITDAERAELQAQGVSDPAEIANVQDLLDASIAELLLSPSTTSGSDHFIFQSALNDTLAGINNNESIFILP